MKFGSFSDKMLILFVISILFEKWDPFSFGGVFSIARMIGIFYLVSILPVLRDRINPRHFGRLFLLLIIFYFFYSFSSIVNFNYVIEIGSVFSFGLLQNILMLLLISNHIIYKPAVLKPIFNTFLGGIVILGILSFFGIGYEESVDEFTRKTLFGENPNSFGNKAVMGFVIVMHYMLFDRPRKKVYFFILLLTIPIIFNMLISTASRGALVAFLLILVIGFFYIQIRLVYKLIIVAIVGFGAYFMLSEFLLSSESLLATRAIQTIEEGNIGGRDYLFLQAIDNFLANPFFGISRVPLSNSLSIYRDPHNVFLSVLVASGLFGFIPFLIFNYKLFVLSVNTYKEYKIPVFLVLFILVLFIMLKQGGFLNAKLLWFTYALVIGGYYGNAKNKVHFS